MSENEFSSSPFDTMIPPKDQPPIDSFLYEASYFNEDNEVPQLVHHIPGAEAEKERFVIHRETTIVNNSSLPNSSDNPLDWVALAAMLLGVVMGVSFLTACLSDFYQLPFYIGSLALFHFLEYFITARYNTPKVSYDSYLFRNGAAYLIAHVVSLIESLAEYYFFPQLHHRADIKILSVCGVFVIAIGQIVRSLAMIHGATNFSHKIVQKKTQNHTLVTTGVYSLLRHPSYFGFFYWALGTQMLLFNGVGFAAFLVVLWSFFRERIEYEERFLVSFFGKEYMTYRDRVGTGIVGIH